LTYKYTKERKTGKVIYRTDWGHSPLDLLEILSGGEFSNGEDLLKSIQILGLNCGAESRREEHTGMSYALCGIRQLREAMEDKGIQGKRMIAYPNAGVAQLDKSGRTHYLQTPDEMVGGLKELLEAGAYMVGGCCGTGPAHIKAFRRALDESESL
jgi:5-methyltetrahydrofolate--homocysteine methyltransferase